MRADETIARRGVLDSPADYALLALVVVCGAGTLGVWATGQLAGLLTHAAWPPVNIARGLEILVTLPHHLRDPRQAWPLAARPELPGPAGFLLAGSVVLAVLAGATIAAVRMVGTRRTRRGFASRRQLDSSLSTAAVLARGPIVRPSLAGRRFTVTDVGVELGRATPGGMPLAVSGEDSVLLLAAPRQGKTSQVVIPWVRSWPGPALVTSVRTDVLENTAALRGRRGPTLVMAPTGMVAWPHPLRWSPVSGCESFERARQRADVMVTVGKSNDGHDSQNAQFFGMTATNLLAGWLHAAAISGGGMDEVLRWGLDERLDEPVLILRDHPAAAPGTAGMLDNIYRSPAETTRSNLWTTAQTAIAPLLAPAARAAFTPPPGRGVDLAALLRANGTVYLLVSEKQAADLAPLIATFVDEFTETAKRLADASPGGRLDPPLGLFLDEVANVSPLPHLPALMSYAGGTGMFVTAVLQNLAQAEARWGRSGAAMMWGAATVKIALGGLSGAELRELSGLAGDYREALTTQQRGAAGHYSLQTTLNDRRTITPEQIRTLSPARREALVLHATTPAVKVRMPRHYEGPHRHEFAAAVTEARRIVGTTRDVPSASTEGAADVR
jgi:type IV secretory pathway TraG/TraD family ATPase VirD4